MTNIEGNPAIRSFSIRRYDADSGLHTVGDELAAEEPLEISVSFGPVFDRTSATLSITMRTPGNDAELAAGFLFTEGIISGPESIRSITRIGVDWIPGETANAVRVDLDPDTDFDPDRFQRHFYTSSSCGICGKTSIESVRSVASGRKRAGPAAIDAATITRLPETLREAQTAFDRTGGLHASALFSADGALIIVREDVGRHNALDKLIGAHLLAGNCVLSNTVLLVSGRASFELVQKAVMAGVPVLAAVGAPSSLAVELAAEFGMTLIGFVRSNRFNVYTDGSERIRF
jgi:FdhD protein